MGNLFKLAFGWATSGSLWPLGAALALGLAIGTGLTTWGASYIVSAANKAEAAETKRADLMADFAITQKAQIDDRDASIKDLSAQIDDITTQAAFNQQAAMDIAQAAQTRSAELETVLTKARKQANATGEKNDLSDTSKSVLGWMRCQERAAVAGPGSGCTNEAGLSPH